MTGRRVDVAIIGDGPAGSALAAQCVRHGVDVLLVGGDREWTATYGCWVDDLARAADDLALGSLDDWFVHTMASISAFGERHHALQRAYGVIHNDRLKGDLRRSLDHLVGRVDHVEPGPAWHHVVLVDDGLVHARLIVDAAGWPPRFSGVDRKTVAGDSRTPAWQTAFGVVLREPPDGDLGTPTLMDFRPPRALGGSRESTIGPFGVTTFGYALPVGDGWLVEETVLAARPPVEPVSLVARLAARLGRHPDELLADAVRSEYVRIPMGGALPPRDRNVVMYGSAAGYVHPATGYSVAASIGLADRVASAIARAVDRNTDAGTVIDPASVWGAVWPTSMRRTRVLHDYGLEVLLGLDSRGVAEFFSAFFELPVDRWSAFLRIDSAPAEVASVMSSLFRTAPWSLRRRLVARNPLGLAHLIRP